MLTWLPLLLCVLAQQCASVVTLNYTSLGCWKDDVSLRAVPSMEGDPFFGGSAYTTRTQAVKKCAQVAFNNDYTVFVIQNGGWCGTSANASSTYKKYGPSTSCVAGKGGPRANDVYQLIPSGYIRGSYLVVQGQNSINPTRRITVAFDTCLSGVPINITTTIVASGSYQFKAKITGTHLWGFTANVTRIDKTSGHPSTFTLQWSTDPNNIVPTTSQPTTVPSTNNIVPTTSQPTTVPSTHMTANVTRIDKTSGHPSTSSLQWSTDPHNTVLTTSQRPNVPLTMYCNRTSVPRRNVSYTFPRTKVGLTSVSLEKCQNGNPIASVDCIISSTQPNKATFGVPFTIDCSTTLETVASQTNSSNATTTSVQNTVATLKLLTSNSSAMTSTHIKQAVATLSSLSQTNQQTVNITINTMYDALVTADHISASYGQASNVTLSSSTTANQQEKQSVVKAISAFADRVILPPNSTNIILTTKQITLQVTEPTTINAKHAAVTFGSSGNAPGEPVAVVLPGSLFDEAHSTLYPRAKRSAATSASPMRASVAVYYNNTLFPAAQNPPIVLSVQIRGYQPSTTTTAIQLNFTNTKAKQGSVPFKNESLKESVTRTQCNVYQASDGSWHPNGCTLVMGSSPPRCSCHKLASFSMIVSTKVFPSAFAQGVVSYIGCSLSILGLVITIFVYLSVKQLRTRQPTKFLLNICFNLLLVNLIFVFGAANVDHSSSCFISAALMHFFLLATWFWMSANAHNMYKALVEMMVGGEKSFVVPTLICYLIPFIAVLINSTITVFYVDKHNHVPDDPFFESSYRARHMCWLREYSLHFGFLLPVGILALFNMICFVVVMVKITCKKTNIQSTANKRSKKDDFIIAISVCVVMGLTWLFGFLMMVSDNVTYQTVMSWLFTIFNSTQGLFIFLMNCVRQKKVRDMWWLPLVACVTCKKLKAHDRENSVFYTSNTRSTKAQ